MLDELKCCRQNNLNTEIELQHCFDVANEYKEKLLAEVDGFEFESIAEEIFFFKKVKPLFCAEITYFTYCYHANYFTKLNQDCNAGETELFYHRQLQRMEKFMGANNEFYQYVIKGRTDRDACWFTRCRDCHRSGIEERNKSSHDNLMGTYLAIKKFEGFVWEQLRNISPANSPEKTEK